MKAILGRFLGVSDLGKAYRVLRDSLVRLGYCVNQQPPGVQAQAGKNIRICMGIYI